MLSMMPSCMPRQHPKRFENQTENRPRKWVNSKSAVEAKLAEHAANPPVWAKYAWVASYHNYFCDLHPKYFDEEHRVNFDLFKAVPSLIVGEG